MTIQSSLKLFCRKRILFDMDLQRHPVFDSIHASHTVDKTGASCHVIFQWLFLIVSLFSSNTFMYKRIPSIDWNKCSLLTSESGFYTEQKQCKK